MSLKQKQGVVILVLGVSLVMVIAGASGDKTWAEVTGFIGLLAGFALDLAWHRCPHCGEHLGKYSGEYCKHCGKAIDYDAKT